MANQGTIQQFGQSSNGKPKVQIDGQWFFLGKSDMSTVNVGDRISYESRSSNFNGRDLWFIDKYAKLPGTTNGVHAAPPQNNAQPPVSRATPTPPNGMSEGERLCVPSEHLPFVSNTVAHAIDAGLIKDRVDLGLWVAAARGALTGKLVLAETSRQPGEDDDKF